VARFARVVAVDVPHHVTQRGNARQFVLATDQDRVVYLELLVRYAQVYHLSLIGYCLMSNHVHLVAIPHRANTLAMVLKQTHGRYAAYWNTSHGGWDRCERVRLSGRVGGPCFASFAKRGAFVPVAKSSTGFFSDYETFLTDRRSSSHPLLAGPDVEVMVRGLPQRSQSRRGEHRENRRRRTPSGTSADGADRRHDHERQRDVAVVKSVVRDILELARRQTHFRISIKLP